MNDLYAAYLLSGCADTLPALRNCFPFRVGAAVAPWQLRGGALEALCARHFSSLTCENVMKPENVLDRAATLQSGSETRAQITLAKGRPIAEYAKAHGMTLRFHVLVWHQQTPRWFFTKGWDNAEDAPLVSPQVLLQRMDNYIHDVMSAVNAAWPGLISAWDVVNEAVEPDHGHPFLLRTKNSLYYQILGEEYLRAAFTMARKYAAPGQKLFYNDFNSFAPRKQEAILRFLTPLAREGLVDGMGMQTHLTMDFPRSMEDYDAALRKYAALGLTIHATEVDIRCPDGSPAGEAALAQRYRELFDIYRRACADGIDLESVTLWGMTDDCSWINRPDRPSWPLLFGAGGSYKPAYFGAMGDADACRPPIDLEQPLNIADGAASVLLDWRCDAPAVMALHLDGAAEPCAQVRVPAAKNWRKQLFLLDTPISGAHTVTLTAPGVSVRECTFHTAQETAVAQNPIIGADFPDIDIIRVDDAYYMVSTTMHFMPGGVLLRSYDLLHWEITGHLYEHLPETPGRRLENGKNAYGQGMWAPSMRYHEGTFYVTFSCNDTHCSYLYTAKDFSGPWTLHQMDDFYYDASLFFDDDGRVYIIHGQRKPRITELESDCLRKKPGGLDRQLLDYGSSKQLGYEGLHMYKIGGRYHLFTIHSNRERWFREESVFGADSLTGEFTGGVLVHDDASRKGCGVAQGGCVDTPDGRWFCFLFQDRGAVGRIPMLLPMHWELGHPVVEAVPETVVNLSTHPGHSYAPILSEDFTAPAWEWNHIPRLDLVERTPDTLRVTLSQASPTLTEAPNQLTQRVMEPATSCEVTVDASDLRCGDMAGLCVLQSQWAYIALKRTAEGLRLVALTRSADDPASGVVRADLPWPTPTARLRVTFDFTDAQDTASLWYWQSGTWRLLHANHPMRFTLDHFVGNRISLTAYSPLTPGGAAIFKEFHVERT